MLLATKILHHLGLILVIYALGGVALHRYTGGSRDFAARRFIALVHGIGMLLLFLGGFGQAHLHGFAAWIWIKLAVWLLLGLSLAILYRAPARLAYWIVPGFALIAALAVLLKIGA